MPNLLPFLTSEAARARARLAFTNEDRANLDRWAISIAAALILHGGIVAALLSWHISIFPQRPVAPFLIDLLPLPAAPAAEASQTASQPASAAAERAEAAPSASQRVITNTPDAAAPRASAPADAGTENNAAGKTDSGGGGAIHAGSNSAPMGAVQTSPLPGGGMNAMPLDTSVTVMPSLYGKKAGGGMARQKKNTMLLRPSKHPLIHANEPQRTHNLNAVSGAPTRTNAVGAHVQDRVRAAFARAAGRAEIRNSVGGTAVPGIVPGGAAGANAADGMTKNAIGMTVPIHPGAPTTNTGEPKTAAVAPDAAGANMNRAVISGHDMIRSGVRTGAIGGPAKNTAGVLNGTDFQVRHR